MPDVGTPTLDQIRVFLAVVETGSFSAAARRLNRRQSVISYTIANLEQQLGGMSLFDRGMRRPALTDAGKAILADARKLNAGLGDLQARARGLQQGLEAEVALAVDVMFPTCRLVAALTAFRQAFPSVTLRLYTEALGSVTRLVLDGTCTVGASGPLPGRMDDLVSHPLGETTMVPVVAPSHPLAAVTGPVSRSDLGDHIQLVLTDRSTLTMGRDFGVLSPQTWRLADLGAKHALLLQGFGWGAMPAHHVAVDLHCGRLVRLDLPALSGERYAFSGLFRADRPPGPAARWLLDRLAAETGTVEAESLRMALGSRLSSELSTAA